MKKHLNLLFVLFASLQTLFAQYNISGKVTDNQGNTVSNAEVMLNTLVTSTNKNGEYLFDSTIEFDFPVELHFVRIEEFDNPDAYNVLILSS